MALFPWKNDANRRYISPAPPYSINAKVEETGFDAKFTRTNLIGIAQPSGSSVYYYFYLYKAKEPNYTYPGYYYRVGSSTRFNKYVSGTYGTKPVSQVTSSVSNQIRDSGAASISTTTARTYGTTARIGPSADALAGQAEQASLQSLAGQRFTGTADFAERVTNQLRAKGYSPLEIQAYLRARDDKELGFVKRSAEARIKAALDRLFGGQSPGGSGNSSGRSGGGSSNGSNPGAEFGPISYPELQTRLVVRMPAGYLVPDARRLASITSPALNQTFLDPDGKVHSYTYTFDYIPQSIQYNNMGSEWVEIPRSENYPFVDWSRFKLMRVSMSWIVALDRVEPGGSIVHDGFFRSVDSNIVSLRRMAERKHPVSIVNMDDLLSVQLKVDGSRERPRSVRGMQFVITDLSVTAARRTTDPSTGEPTTPSKIAVAQCQMTLQEVPIESVQIVSLPKLNIPFSPPKSGRPPSNPLVIERPLQSDTAIPTPIRTYATGP